MHDGQIDQGIDVGKNTLTSLTESGAKAKTIPDYPRMFLVGTHFDQLALVNHEEKKEKKQQKFFQSSSHTSRKKRMLIW